MHEEKNKLQLLHHLKREYDQKINPEGYEWNCPVSVVVHAKKQRPQGPLPKPHRIQYYHQTTKITQISINLDKKPRQGYQFFNWTDQEPQKKKEKEREKRDWLRRDVDHLHVIEVIFSDHIS